MRSPLFVTIGRGQMWRPPSSFARINTGICIGKGRAAATKREIILAGWTRKKRSRGRSGRKKIERPPKGGVAVDRSRQSAVTNTGHNDIAGATIDPKFSPARFLNPWTDLSRLIPNEEALHDRVESTTRTFGIVAALMGSLAAALLTFNPTDGYDANREPVRNSSVHNSNGRSINSNDNSPQQPFSPLPIRRRNTIGFIEHVTFTHHVSGTSLLVSWGIPESRLDDIYTACCAGSFYSGVLTTVLSSVINAWLAATPPGGVRSFVRVHSWYIVSLPALLGISTGLAGSALFIGLDREHGTPVSYVGLGGTAVGGAALGLVTGRGWVHTYKSLTKAVSKGGSGGGLF